MATENNAMRRIELLETQNRWLKSFALFAVVGVSLTLLLGMAEKPEESLKTTKLVLVDQQGKSCAWLELNEEGFPQLRLKKAGSHLTVGLQEQAAYLASGTSGRGVTYFGVNEAGPYLNFRGGNLKNGAWLGVEQDGSTGLHLYGETLEVGAAVRIESDGSPTIRLADDAGKLLEKFPSSRP